MGKRRIWQAPGLQWFHILFSGPLSPRHLHRPYFYTSGKLHVSTQAVNVETSRYWVSVKPKCPQFLLRVSFSFFFFKFKGNVLKACKELTKLVSYLHLNLKKKYIKQIKKHSVGRNPKALFVFSDSLLRCLLRTSPPFHSFGREVNVEHHPLPHLGC